LKRILAPTDFSANSRIAVDYACALAAQNDSELHLLHVLQDIMVLAPPDPTGVYGLPANYEDRIRAAAEAALTALPDQIWPGRHRVVRALRQGSAFAEIVRYARENEIDLIVIGTHGRTGLAHVLLGSVAEKVVRKADCPVLTVRTTNHTFVMP
jgi:nucleotide-binding universal stress UspA family protein